MHTLRLLNVITIALSLATSVVAHAVDVPQSFTLDGRLFSDTAGTVPMADGNIGFKIQILDEDKVCVLYEENQNVNTVFSQGYFSVQVGSAVGAATRSPADSGNSMSNVFQNINTITGAKVSDSTVCNVAAVGGRRRFVRITITPSTMGGTPRVLSPDLTIDSVPNAVVAERAETLQGYRSSDMLKVNSTGSNVLTQSNLESLFVTSTRFNALSALVDGTSTNYVKASSNGAQIPVLTGAPAAPTQGSIWYDTSDNKLKYRTGIATTEVLGTGSGSVSSVALTAPSELSVAGGPITSSGTLALSWANQTTNKVLAAPDGSTGAPTFRALAAGDIPALSWSKITSGTPTTLAGYGITDAVANAGTTPSIQSGLDAGKSAADNTKIGRLYVAYDTQKIYRDNGTTWDVVSSVAAANGITGSGTTNAIPRFTASGAIGNSGLTDDGTVITATRSISSVTNPIASGAVVNLATSNSHTLTSVGGSTITVSGMTDGGVYNIVIEDPASRTYTFSGCTHAYFKPANATTTLNTRTVYGLMTVKKGATWDCYVTWSSGFIE